MRKIINIIIGPMTYLGLNPLERDTFLTCYIRILLCFVTIAYGMYGTIFFTIHANSDFYNFVVPTAYTLSLLSVIVTVLMVQKHKSSIRDVLSRINDNVFTYPDEDNLHPNYKTYLSEENHDKVSLLVLLLQIFGFIIALLSPFVGYVLVGSFNFYPYPQWTYWKVDSTFRYVLTYSLQLLVVTIVFLNFYTIQTYHTFVLVEFLRQYEKLKCAVETLNGRSQKTLLGARVPQPSLDVDITSQREEFDRIVEFNLIMCIRHHQKLYHLFKPFKTIYEFVYSLELAMVTFSFSLVLYCLVEESDPARRLNLIGVAWEVMGTVFFKCLIGEEFSEMVSSINTQKGELSIEHGQLGEDDRAQL